MQKANDNKLTKRKMLSTINGIFDFLSFHHRKVFYIAECLFETEVRRGMKSRDLGTEIVAAHTLGRLMNHVKDVLKDQRIDNYHF
ncbi:hypothetical protein P5673_019812 [Acropora cervicornis]|uniref:Uncharacterized protein n=1 Tax=Acropora cervicornis TaxID=6130 RepID=A0AAD9V206_ACRCE|nr:hypothetical protein P5673_019812 [Acropora cervicornis]